MSVRLLRRPEVSALTGLGRSALYAAIQAGEFPAPIKLGKRAVAWPSDELEAWIASRIAARDAGATPACR